MNAKEDAGKRASLLAFGRLLKRLRGSEDLTQEELAERAMVSARLISDLERGSTHRPRRDTVELLADGLRLRGADRESFIALARGRPLIPAELTVADAARRPTLPRPPTPIVGRLKETASVTALLLDPEVQLLTLTGPGGVGKTRLALEVAARVADTLQDGALFVDLAPVRDPELVLGAIAQALGVVPGREQSLAQAVVAVLAEKRLLLVFDNFEHVATAATVIADLLAACPMLTVLTTSREPLRIRAEYDYEVNPLVLPDLRNVPPLDELARVPAVDLFVRRAEAANRRFALTVENARVVAEIAVRLDGLPLAIELAATRVKVLPPSALLQRLERRLPLLTIGARDLPGRQQTLRDTIAWSHDLLSPREQSLFRRLAIFVGGFTLEAVEWVSEEGVGERKLELGSRASSPLSPLLPLSEAFPFSATLDLLTGLVDKSLLSVRDDDAAEQRFGMLETIREYGLERLAAAGEEHDARCRHLHWSLALAERAEPELIGADQQEWFARLEIEHDNLRAALGWAIARDDATTALRMGGALYRFWATEGLYEEGRRWLEQALALDDGEPSEPRGNALLGAGVMAFFQGEYEWAAIVWDEALSLFCGLGHTRGVAYSHGNLGLVADAQGDYARAKASYDAALTLFRELDDRTFIAYMLHNLGLIAYFETQYGQATTLFSESLALVRALGDQNSVAMTLGNLGLVAFAQGDYDRARELHEESLALGRSLSNKPWLARGIEHFALVAAATRQAERAARLFGAAAAMRAELGASIPPNDREFNERHIAAASAQLGAAAFAAAWAEGEAMSPDEAIAYALG